jgi:DNA repair exonuclease SbcCD ATPase subunit
LQSRSVQSQLSRVQQLEQALDQALACIADLRPRLQDQQRLENQLADTESYASVQQQAIVRLKLQIAEQQQALEIQRLETQQRDQAIQELLSTIESMTQSQQQEGERLRSRLVQDQQQVQSHRSRLGKHLQELQAVLEARQRRVMELETEMLAAHQLSASLQQQLTAAQQQIQLLSGQFELTSWRPASQPSSAQPPDSQQQASRLSQLEQQIAEMQEQILQQAQQETEYETAVQYWKDRYFSQRLKALPFAPMTPLPQSADQPPRLSTVELPKFLVRRRAASKAELPAPAR